MIYGVVYVITCLLDGMKYVGQTKRSIEQRFKEHASAKNHLGNAIRKYGRENFKIEVLEECETPERLDECEIFWIAKLNCKQPNGYNLTDGGEGFKGFKRTQEHNAKIGAANKGIPKSAKHRAKLAVIKTLTAKRAYSPYSNLVALLTESKLSYTDLAHVLGITQEGMSYKMCGKHNFSLAQPETIKNFLGVEMPLCDLFRKADGSIPNLTPKIYIYPVLEAELQKRKITHKKLGNALGLDKSSVGLKMRGKVNFSPEQKAAVKEFLKVEMSIEELFKRRE